MSLERAHTSNAANILRSIERTGSNWARRVVWVQHQLAWRKSGRMNSSLQESE